MRHSSSLRLSLKSIRIIRRPNRACWCRLCAGAGRKPSVDGDKGRKAVEPILALYQSAQAGGVTVKLPHLSAPSLSAHAK